MNNIATAAPATATAAQGSGEPEATQVVAIVAVVAVVELDKDFAFDFCIAKRGFFDVGVATLTFWGISLPASTKSATTQLLTSFTLVTSTHHRGKDHCAAGLQLNWTGLDPKIIL